MKFSTDLQSFQFHNLLSYFLFIFYQIARNGGWDKGLSLTYDDDDAIGDESL